jgi:hypothetical protein
MSNNSDSKNVICVVCRQPIQSIELAVVARKLAIVPMHYVCYTDVQEGVSKRISIINSSSYGFKAVYTLIAAIVIATLALGVFGKIPPLPVNDLQVEWRSQARSILEFRKCDRLPQAERRNCVPGSLDSTRYEREIRDELSESLNREPYPTQFLWLLAALPFLGPAFLRLISWVLYERPLYESTRS